MKRTRRHSIAALLAAGGLVLAACGNDDDATTDTTAAVTETSAATDTAAPDTAVPETAVSETAAPDTAAATDTAATETAATETTAAGAATGAGLKSNDVIYVSPNEIGVNDFLKLGQVGTEAAAAALGGSAKTYESKDPITRKQNVEAAVRDGAGIVVVLGFEFGDIIPEVAKANPDVKFLVVDQTVENAPSNVYAAVFREYEATYLAGAEAALVSKANKVGAIGALDIPFLHRYTDAFEDGAKAAKADVGISQKLWVGGDNPFADPVRAEQQATAMIADGADVIMAATAGGNGGIFKAAAAKAGTLAIGVDVNQCTQSPGQVLDNVEKGVDAAIVQAVDGIAKGTQQPITSYGLKEGGLTLTSLKASAAESQCEALKYPEAIAKVKEIRDAIVAGTTTLQDPLTNPRK